MRILVIGGTGFIGSFVVRDLLEQGHKVAVFHRGSTGPVQNGAREIIGDIAELGWKKLELIRFGFDVALHCILSSERQAKGFMDVVRGVVPRVVALSSQDVYRAYGILLGIEPGPIQPLPITEESDLRAKLYPYPPEHVKAMQQIFPWLDEKYDKIPVERVIMGDEKLPGTVLRVPMVYGPGDPLHRFHPTLKRVDDGRPAILIQEDLARWRAPRGYVENVSAAIALATTSPKASGRTYNIAEPDAIAEGDWTRMIADSAGWKGKVIPLPKEKLPAHLRADYNTDQDWIVSSARIRDELGYAERVPVAEGIRRTIVWERANPPAAPADGSVDARFDYAAEDAALT